MRFLTLALYLGTATIANADPAAWSDLRDGDMRRMNFHAEPKPASEAAFLDAEDGARTLEDFRGKYVLLNFWALWCAPCREEMPALDALQQELGGEEFEVVTVAVWRNALPAIEAFYAEHGIEALPILRDPDRSLSAAMGVAAMPTTVLLNPEGEEIGRLLGDADWAGPEAVALVSGITGAE